MPDTFLIPPPSSGGLILSYQCSNRCRHCLYACSPEWRDWMSAGDMDRILRGLKKHGRYLTGLHIAGGEPLLKPDAAVLAVEKAAELGILLDYVETNAFWCWNDENTTAVFQRLKEAGLPAVMVSVSPFHLEFVPLDRMDRAITIGKKVFGPNRVYLFTNYYYEQFHELDRTHPIPFEDYVDAVGRERASLAFATEYSLIPNGRAATELKDLYEHHPASHFFGGTCERELASPHHIHIDLYGNYIAGLCAGISLGDGRDLDDLFSGIDLETRPFLRRVIRGGMETLYAWAAETFGYEEKKEGYIAKCHLCLDIRRHLVAAGADAPELAPSAFYENL